MNKVYILLAIVVIIFIKCTIDKQEDYRRYPGSLDSDFSDQSYRQGSPFKYSNQRPGTTGLSVRGIGGPY